MRWCTSSIFFKLFSAHSRESGNPEELSVAAAAVQLGPRLCGDERTMAYLGFSRHFYSCLPKFTAASSAARRRKRPSRPGADLPAMTQIVIGDHASHHGFADRHGADADARIVAASGYDFG